MYVIMNMDDSLCQLLVKRIELVLFTFGLDVLRLTNFKNVPERSETKLMFLCKVRHSFPSFGSIT